MRKPPRAVPRSVATLIVCALAACATLAVALGAAAPAGAVTGQYWVGKLALHKVWAITRGAGITVAVVDSGVPPTSALGSRLLAGRNIATGSGNGRSDAGVSTGGIGGTYSHGQNMAEIIAGDGSGGLAGIAPEAKILPVKVGVATGQNVATSAITAGIRYAVAQGVQVINLSVGGDGSCDSSEAAAVRSAYQHDIVVVAGAGDNGVGTVETPANCPGALAVSGIDSKARPWSGSNYGPEIDITNFAKNIPGVSSTGGQGPTNGTSAATAFTSGEVALLRAAYPHDSARAIVTRMLYGIDNLTASVTNGTRVNDHVGYGVPVPLDALRDKVPSDAPNPIYDQFLKQLGPGSGNTKAGGGSSPPASSGAPSGSPASNGLPSNATPSGSASGSGGSGIGPVVVVVIVVVVVVAAVVAVVVARSRRRRPPGYGPPPPGYGPPPPGYGPPPGY